MSFKLLPVKPTIKIEDLNKIDVRVGTIEKVEDIKESDKLVRLTVNFGDHKRTVLAGMKKERPDIFKIKGKQALFVVNLEPKKILGEISQGMIFDVGYPNGMIPLLAIPEKKVPDGASLG